MKHLTELRAFIKARHAIHTAREKGRPKPWTDDPILQRYRFCNICREWDTVTQWVSANITQPNADHGDLWFVLFMARIFNWPPTLDQLGFPLPWGVPMQRRIKKIVEARIARGDKVWTGAYMVSTNGHRKIKHDYFLEDVFPQAWAMRAVVRPRVGDTLESFSQRLLAVNGMAHFMVGQVIADLKYVEPLRSAPDWLTWCVPGPGSKRGLNRVLGRELMAPWKVPAFQVQMAELQKVLNYKTKDGPLHAQDIQNCLCEFDKYERVRLGQGRPRSTYSGV